MLENLKYLFLNLRDASLGGEHTSVIEREVFLNISNSQHSLSALRGSASLWEKCNICLLFFDFCMHGFMNLREIFNCLGISAN